MPGAACRMSTTAPLSDEVLQRTEMSRRARGGTRERRSKWGPRDERPFSDGQRREGWSRALRCPIYDCVYKGLSPTDRVWSGGANADRNRFALSYGPFPTARKARFDDRETDAAMFHGGPPLTFSCASIEATAFARAGPAQQRSHAVHDSPRACGALDDFASRFWTSPA